MRGWASCWWTHKVTSYAAVLTGDRFTDASDAQLCSPNTNPVRF